MFDESGLGDSIKEESESVKACQKLGPARSNLTLLPGSSDTLHTTTLPALCNLVLFCDWAGACMVQKVITMREDRHTAIMHFLIILFIHGSL